MNSVKSKPLLFSSTFKGWESVWAWYPWILFWWGANNYISIVCIGLSSCI